MNIIGKKMNGSGIAGVLPEAGLTGSGSIPRVLSGKHYDRTTHCLKILMEGLDRMMFERYLQMNSEDILTAYQKKQEN